MKNSDKLLYQIALTKIHGVGEKLAKQLLASIGDEKQIFHSSIPELCKIQGINKTSAQAIKDSKVLKEAEEELNFINKNKISCYFYTEENYPKRLRECNDAPILLYYKGNTTLDDKHIISIVGTRNSTTYGNDFCEKFIEDISTKLNDVIIVSGLAFGIDIHAHRAALKNKINTVGVVAHGLDRIYPNEHRNTAAEMINQGGILTEFGNKTKPDRFNFVRRNRIIAGLADATIVVESNSKGGALITAELANSYCRDVFALAGRYTDKRSEGCNQLIASHKADLFLSTDEFIKEMNWDISATKPKQLTIFQDFTSEEREIMEQLITHEVLHIDQLALQLEKSSFELLNILLNMELKGYIQNIPGNSYRIKN